MSKGKGILSILLGLLMVVVAVVMFVRESKYILTGYTVDLNTVLENGEEPPRGEFVTYTCEWPLGNYAETQEYLNGFIPLPFKTQQYAVVGEDGTIFSAEVKNKKKIAELDQAIDDFYDDKEVSVTLVGCIATNDSEMNGYLQEFMDYIMDGESMSDYGLSMSSYVIDTTQTRSSQALLYLFFLALGGVFVVFGVRSFTKG